jgi:hypothetical protein
MQKAIVFAAVAVALAAPVPAHAQASLALRAGYAVPFGDAANVGGFGAFTQRELFARQLPVQLDASWRITPAFWAGLYAGYGFASAGSQLQALICNSASSCTGLRDLHVGARAEWRFGRVGGAQPWVGLTGGLESAHFKAVGATFPTGQAPPAPATVSGNLEGSLRGWEVGVEAGADWRVSSALAVGPFLQLQLGQYRVQDITFVFSVPGNGEIPAGKPHELFTLGLRARADL